MVSEIFRNFIKVKEYLSIIREKAKGIFGIFVNVPHTVKKENVFLLWAVFSPGNPGIEERLILGSFISVCKLFFGEIIDYIWF